MPAGPGGLDAQGIWRYGEADFESLASDLLELGQEATSTQFGLDRTRLGTLETKTAVNAIAITATNAVSWADVKIRKIGNRLTIEGTASRATDITVSLAAGTLPVGARPSKDFLFAAVSMTSGFSPSFIPVIITTAGIVQFNAPVAVAAGSRFVGLNCSFEVA